VQNLDVLERDAEAVVTWLCPWGEVPMKACTVPVGRKRIVTASQPPAP
jgi:hypothetical protein